MAAESRCASVRWMSPTAKSALSLSLYPIQSTATNSNESMAAAGALCLNNTASSYAKTAMAAESLATISSTSKFNRSLTLAEKSESGNRSRISR